MVAVLLAACGGSIETLPADHRAGTQYNHDAGASDARALLSPDANYNDDAAPGQPGYSTGHMTARLYCERFEKCGVGKPAQGGRSFGDKFPGGVEECIAEQLHRFRNCSTEEFAACTTEITLLRLDGTCEQWDGHLDPEDARDAFFTGYEPIACNLCFVPR
jgi:hypothetical protein